MIITDKIAITRMPRTGSTWCRDVVLACLGSEATNLVKDGSVAVAQHTTWRDAKVRAAPRLASLVSFVQVRNPHQWLRSLHSFAVQREGAKTIKVMGQGCVQNLARLYDDDFNLFASNVNVLKQGIVSSIYAAYTEGVDFIGTTEHCSRDLYAALYLAGHRPAMRNWSDAPVNCSTRKAAWDTTLAAEFEQSEAEAFAIWNKALTHRF